MMTGRTPGRADAHLEHPFYHLGSGDIEVREIEWNVDTIGHGGLPSSGFVTEEVREALRLSGGFPTGFQEEGLDVTGSL
jgi:hypothetical protein